MQKDCYNSRFWKLFKETGNVIFYVAAREEMHTNQPILLTEKYEEKDFTL